MPNKRKSGELISIIVPVYRVEKYLFRCVDSLVKQTYSNLEIILVDDGSPDNSGKLCDDYAKKDNRVKVVHKKNGGLSSARNAGIDVMAGQYVLFVDSDDYIAPETVEHLYEDITKTGADISICDFIPFTDKKQSKNSYPKTQFILSGEEKFAYIAPSEHYSTYGVVSTVQWNKLFKAEIFAKLRYEDGRINEDEFIVAEEFNLANKISYNLKPLYYYYQREDSIIHSFSLNRLDIVDAIDARIKFYKKHHLDSYVHDLTKMKITFLIDFVGFHYKDICRLKDGKKTIKELIAKNKSDAKALQKTDVPSKMKLKIKLLLGSPIMLNSLFSATGQKETK
ncbi:MAG: glycosyltransferase [Candidatus Saccharibacteria bacterium]|nr:glycosyltransferase [Candidatus Saccharibacteria bacterium]